MKKILYIPLIFLAQIAFAQSDTTYVNIHGGLNTADVSQIVKDSIDSIKTVVPVNLPIYVAPDSSLNLKNDSMPIIAYRPGIDTATITSDENNIPNLKWILPRLGSSSAGKLNISDTSAMLSPYVRSLKLYNDSSTLATAINLKANNNAVVHLSGNDTVAGVKYFTDNAIFNSLSGTTTINGALISGNRTVYYNGNDYLGGIMAFYGTKLQFKKDRTAYNFLTIDTTYANFSVPIILTSASNAVGDFVTRNSSNGIIAKRTATEALSDMGGLSTTTAASTYEPKITKGTAFNKDFGITTGTVADGKRMVDSIAVLRALVQSKQDSIDALKQSVTQQADYVIEKVGSTIYARPNSHSTLPTYSGTDAYTVIQNAINALTPAGAVGTGGGKIHIRKGSYSLSNELTIIGWESSFPLSQLIIEGEGNSTWINQPTSGKNALVIKNMPSVKLTDMKISAESGARSAILLDSDGATYPCSMYKSYWNNLTLIGTSTTYPAVYMKNFMNLEAGLIIAQNVNGNAMIWENNSTDILYGNSTFGFLKVIAGTNSGNTGLLIKSTDASKMMNLISVQHFECLEGDYGIRTDYATRISFDYIDIEYINHPISLGTYGSGSANDTYSMSFNGGYILPNSGMTSIECPGVGNGANNFKNIFIDGDATSTPITDGWPSMGNSYDVILGYNVVPSNIDAASPNTLLRYRSMADGTTYERLPTKVAANIDTAPSSATAAGTKGEVRFTATGIYICTATNTWIKCTGATF